MRLERNLLIAVVCVMALILLGLVLYGVIWPLKMHDGVITAIGTAVIGLFTVVLGVVAWFQYWHARDVDRAYVTAGGDLARDAANRIVFRLEVENIGRSAAIVTSYDVKFGHFASVRLPAKALDVVERANVHDDRLGPAGTGRSDFKVIETPVLLNGSEDIVYGAVWYRDIWGQPHRSRFILRIVNGHTRVNVDNVDEEYRRLT
jgi:hypothetical protein